MSGSCPTASTATSPPTTSPRGPDVTGELWIKGPNVVRGYWNKPDATAATFTKGWLHSGDVARIDQDGFVYIVDRAKDMVIRGGENVYSVEVEAALFEHPAVADTAVIGVPHDVLGEEVGAAVVLRPGAKVTAEELTRHVKERLAGFKVPTHIWFRSEPLPRNPQGKVLKRELRNALGGRQFDRRHDRRRGLRMGLLEGRRAVVTGGGSGIGRAACRRFAAEGAAVAVLDIDRDSAQATAQEIDGFASGVDVTDAEALRVAVDAAAAQLGGVSILVNNAGGSTMVGLADWDPEEWDRIVRLNLTGVFNGMRAGVPHLLAGGGGCGGEHGLDQCHETLGGRDPLLGGQGRRNRAHVIGRARVRPGHSRQRRGAGNEADAPSPTGSAGDGSRAAACAAPPRRGSRPS